MKPNFQGSFFFAHTSTYTTDKAADLLLAAVYSMPEKEKTITGRIILRRIVLA